MTNAALLADVVVVPTGTDQAEIGRVGATKVVLTTLPDGTPIADPPPHAVLLTRVARPGVGGAADARAVLERDGYRVFETEIPNNRMLYSMPWGTLPDDCGAYTEMAKELEEMADFYRTTAGVIS